MNNPNRVKPTTMRGMREREINIESKHRFKRKSGDNVCVHALRGVEAEVSTLSRSSLSRVAGGLGGSISLSIIS